ncbi:hypothetical protein [Massilia sp. HP4]|uniref:hypothetical protein n=1 Tax=Massilia sp. HP4 TaxID=2562316 RepID=UPI001981BE30|nr:hypothetical protein [Massilia sp. HP4]
MQPFHRRAAQAAICLALSAPFSHAVAQTPVQAGPGYSGSVTAIGSNGQASGACTIPAFQVGGGTPPPVFTCTTSSASNYAHVQAGRAHAGGGYALANGSNQNMGLYNTFFTSTLAQTAQGYYIVGNCP